MVVSELKLNRVNERSERTEQAQKLHSESKAKVKANRWHSKYHRYEAIKWDIENGVILLPHKKSEYQRSREIFEKA